MWKATAEARKEGVQPLLLVCRSAPPTLRGALKHHLPGVLREQPAVVP